MTDPTSPPRAKGHTTLRIAGMLFIVSAVFEVFSVTDAVPLFGAVRAGVLAVVYHLLFVTVFLVMGLGLWRATSWGYRAVIAGTGLYVVDRLVYLTDSAAREALITEQTEAYSQLIGDIDLQLINQAVTAVTLVTLLCWIGFAFYVSRRRAYFG